MILETQRAVYSASRSDLNETHEALTGFSIPEPISIEAVRVRVAMMVLACEKIAAEPLNVVSQAIQKGIKMENVYKEGTLCHKLKEEMGKGVGPRIAAESKKRVKIDRIKATGRRSGKGQAESIRTKVYTIIEKAGEEGITLEALEAEVGVPCRGHIAKLMQVDAVEIIEKKEENDEK